MTKIKIDPYLLSNNERLIIKSLRSCSNPSEISNLTHIPRSTVYFTLKKLQMRGMVQNEANIWTFTDNKSSKIDLSGPERQYKKMRVYNTVTEVYNLLNRILSAKNNRLTSINGDRNTSSWIKNIGSNQVVELNKIIKKNKYPSTIIASRKFVKDNANLMGKEWFEAFKDKPNEYYVVPDEYTNYSTQIFMNNDSVYMVNMDKPQIIEFVDPDIYAFFTSITNFIKSKSYKYNVSDLL